MNPKPINDCLSPATKVSVVVGLFVTFVSIGQHFDAQAQSPTPTGKRDVRLTGEITYTVSKDLTLPMEICDEAPNVYKPVPGASFVQLARSQNSADSSAVANLIQKRFSILPDVLEKPIDVSGDLFAFTFEFENGYHTNDPLLDARVTTLQLDGFMGAESLYAGNWDKTSNKVLGIVAVEGPHIAENRTTTGLSVFEVRGEFESSDHLTGTWRISETSALMGCQQSVTGHGVWEASP